MSSVEQGQGGFVRAVKGNHFIYLFLFWFCFLFVCLFFHLLSNFNLSLSWSVRQIKLFWHHFLLILWCFVNLSKNFFLAKHEDIAHEKNEIHRNFKRISVREENIPKGYIPTVTVSLNEHDDKLTISHTKTPLAVPVKPAIIAPAPSDNQMEDPVFHIKQVYIFEQ